VGLIIVDMKLHLFRKKYAYCVPQITDGVSVELSRPILGGSVVTADTEVRTTGQKVEKFDFSDSSFNQTWE